jgi:hypothetical protein
MFGKQHFNFFNLASLDTFFLPKKKTNTPMRAQGALAFADDLVSHIISV